MGCHSQHPGTMPIEESKFPPDQLPIGPSPLLKTSRDEFCFLSLLLTTSISQICLPPKTSFQIRIQSWLPNFTVENKPPVFSSSDVRTRKQRGMHINKKRRETNIAESVVFKFFWHLFPLPILTLTYWETHCTLTLCPWNLCYGQTQPYQTQGAGTWPRPGPIRMFHLLFMKMGVQMDK